MYGLRPLLYRLSAGPCTRLTGTVASLEVRQARQEQRILQIEAAPNRRFGSSGPGVEQFAAGLDRLLRKLACRPDIGLSARRADARRLLDSLFGLCAPDGSRVL